jgi:hypothetical protein
MARPIETLAKNAPESIAVLFTKTAAYRNKDETTCLHWFTENLQRTGGLKRKFSKLKSSSI